VEPQVTMLGNLVGDPTRKAVADGLKVTKFRIAASGRRFDRARNDWVPTDTVFITVNCWRQLGEHVFASLHKGDTVLVHGRLTFREYDDQHGGPRRQSYEVEAWSVAPDLGRVVAMLARPNRDMGQRDAAQVDGEPRSADAIPAQAPAA
jgi:single-strand DNA-binding protein